MDYRADDVFNASPLRATLKSGRLPCVRSVRCRLPGTRHSTGQDGQRGGPERSPHRDIQAARALTRSSAEATAFFAASGPNAVPSIATTSSSWSPMNPSAAFKYVSWKFNVCMSP